MRTLLLLLFAAVCLSFGQEREGNFDIRFEPTAVLQTGVPVPFQITVKDDLEKPLINAKVTLQIELTNHSQVKVFPAPAVGTGVYVAKPIFPVAGQWSIYVEVRRNNARGSRTIQFNVPE